ncbi:MAG: hypothetical protein K2Q45_03895 [Nitrosomonas sp.]|nr:hypothetical protein [Nitrosomonas sp.]
MEIETMFWLILGAIFCCGPTDHGSKLEKIEKRLKRIEERLKISENNN